MNASITGRATRKVIRVTRRSLNRWRNRNRTINVVFRYDDYSSFSATELELKLITLFQSYGFCLTFSVVPFRSAGDVHDPAPQETVALSNSKADILRKAREKGTVDVALHGYSHQTTRTDEMMEFRGLSYQAQMEKIAKGRRFLIEKVGGEIATFVPPWNRYDKDTLCALEAQHFRLISADYLGDASRDSALKFLPSTASLWRLREAVGAARDVIQQEPVVVVLFHDYDFREVNATRGQLQCEDLVDLLEWLSCQRNVRLLSLAQAVEGVKDLGPGRFLDAQPRQPLVY